MNHAALAVDDSHFSRRQLANRMSVDADLKAGLILQDLSTQLSDAQVDYHYRSGHHEFIVRRGDAIHRIAIPERVLLDHRMRVLERWVPLLMQGLLGTKHPRYYVR